MNFKEKGTLQERLESLMTEFVDNNYINVSDALIKKIYQKNYTSKYELELGIFALGSYASIHSLLEKMTEYVSKHMNVKNNFKNFYIIYYDLIEDKYYLLSSKYKKIELKNVKYKFIKKKKIDYNLMKNDTKYLLVTQKNFTNKIGFAYLSKEVINTYNKELKFFV